MSIARRIALVLLLAVAAREGRADVMVQWGENPSGAGTPGTNIVQANQVMTGVTSTYSATATNNPAEGVNYYPDATGRSPRFSAAASSSTNGGGRLIENAASGDRLAIYATFIPAGGTFRGMFMWASNNCVITDRPITLTNATLVSIQRLSSDSTNQALRMVVRQQGNYYISDSTSFGPTVTTQSFPLASLVWHDFTPFASGVDTIGAVVATPSLVNVQAVGFYYSLLNASASAGTCGVNVTYFSVEGFEDTGATTYTLSVAPDDPQRGQVSPTGGTYSAGQTVLLTATASNYYQFAGWGGALGGATNPVTITMDANKSITAAFSEVLATNGTPHWWLAAYGLSTNDTGALSDEDTDGHQAWQEYLAGTLPNAATSVFRVAGLRRPAAGTAIEWTSASGRLYQVAWSTNAQEAFTAFGDATALPWTQAAYTDTIHSAEQQLFLRVDVRRE